VSAPARIAGPDLLIEAQGARACLCIRGDGGDARFRRAVASVVALEPPAQPCQSVDGLLARLLWLGPDEWCVVSETQAAGPLVAALRSSFAGLHAAVTDVSDGCIVYAVSGAYARDVLAKGCALDLHPRAFAIGQCARTLLAKMPVVLHRRAGPYSFELYVARSYRNYAWAWIESAAREYRIQTATSE
jgi:sarcosine oxidase subunit gamma